MLDHGIVMDSGSIVLNRSVAEITEKLDFHTSADGSSVTDALYMRRGLGGYDVIERNESGDFSELNLETLFDFAVSNRNSLYEIFDNNGKDAEDE